MPKSQEDRVEISVPGPLAREVNSQCAEKGVPIDTLIQILLEQWLADGCPDPLDDDVNQERRRHTGFLFATRLFLETLPLETTIKVFEDNQIRYWWVNDLFRMMVGKDLKAIEHKTNAEVWAHAEPRGREIERLDRQVIETGQIICHTDTVIHERSKPRERLGIRFPLSFSRKDVKILGSIGMEFATKEAAETAKRHIILADGGPPPHRSNK